MSGQRPPSGEGSEKEAAARRRSSGASHPSALLRSLLTTGALLALTTSAASASATGWPELPSRRALLVDLAEVATETEAEAARSRLAALLEETRTPIVMVTVSSLPTASAGGAPERWARDLFLHWALAASVEAPDAQSSGDAPEAPSGSARLPRDFGRRGVLILIALTERAVAIEAGTEPPLGPRDLRRLRDHVGKRLAQLAPGAAVVAACEAADTLVRGGKLSGVSGARAALLSALAAIGAIVTIVSYLRAGAESAVSRFWKGLFSGLASLLSFVLRRGMELGSGAWREAERASDRGRIVTGSW